MTHKVNHSMPNALTPERAAEAEIMYARAEAAAAIVAAAVHYASKQDLFDPSGCAFFAAVHRYNNLAR